ncbi:MAG: SGNH/GDSL hydrolase family protein [Rhodobacterales bacterium]|nr:SGNH/GDSL hydrolase family protein [Rhodobacterales bacterium]
MFKSSLGLATSITFLLSISAALAAREAPARILVMGDSLLASHAISGRAVANSIESALQEQVRNRSVVGARILYNLPISGALGLKIAKQYTKGQWDWIVLNGGGNDVWLGCGCNRCDRKINRLISRTGDNGGIPDLVTRLRNTGARIVYVGYLRSPGFDSPIENCKDEGDELEARIKVMANRDNGIYFLSLRDLVPYGDLSFHAVDRIHPSLKASSAIGRLAADIIRRNEPQ